MRKTTIIALMGFELPSTPEALWGGVINGPVSGFITSGNQYHDTVANMQMVALMVTETDPLSLEQVLELSNPMNINDPDVVEGYFYKKLLMDVWVRDDVELDFDYLVRRDALRNVDEEIEVSRSGINLANAASPSEILEDYLADLDSPLHGVLDQSHLDDIAANSFTIDLELAKLIAKTCDTSVEYWLGIDQQYRLQEARKIDAESSVQ